MMLFNRHLFKEAFKAGYKKALTLSRMKNWERLDEWWYSNSTLYNQESKKIVSRWLELVNNSIESLKIHLNFPKSFTNPKKDHDYLLRYIAFCIQKPSYRDVIFDFYYEIKGMAIKFLFEINEKIDEVITTGGTHAESGIVDIIKIELPFTRFEEINKKLESGKQCYGDVEDFITDISMTLAHELTHSIQNISGTITVDDVPNLKFFKLDNHAKEIAFFIYFVGKNEVESIQSEAYKLYKKRGSGIIPRNTGVKKGYIRCLVTAVLRRFKEYRELTNEYNRGELSLLELINAIPESNLKLLILYFCFVIGPDKELSKHDELVKNDPDYTLKDNFNVGVIKNNVNNLKNTFIEFDGKFNLQRLFINYYFSYRTDSMSDALLRGIFSSNRSNEIIINAINDWSLNYDRD